MEMNDQIREHLEDTLKAYTQSIEGVEDFIKTHTQQLDGALQHKETVEGKIADLKELLGVTDDSEVETKTPEPAEA